MNTMGDGEDDPEVPALCLPLSAPVAADMGQSRTDQSYAAHPAVPATAVPATAWPAPAAADDLPPGHPYAAHPKPASVPAPVRVPPLVSVPASAPPPDSAVVAADPAPSDTTDPAPSDTAADDDTATADTAEADLAASDPAQDDPAPDDPAPDDPAASDPEPAPEPAPPTRAGRAGHVAAVGRGGDERAPEAPAAADYLFPGSATGEPPDDPNRVILRKQLDALRSRAASAASWQEASAHYAQLVNSDGVVPVTARFTGDDIEFLGRAREEVLGLAEFGLRLLDLHRPLDAGGISTDPSSPIMRCRSCMWRWPCPTFTLLSETVNQLPHPRSPLGH
jgi:hypothetical protein